MVGKWLAGGLAFGGCGRGLSRAQVLHANHESVDEDATRSEKREWRMAVKSDSADVLLAKYSTVPVTRDRKNEAPSCSRGPTTMASRDRRLMDSYGHDGRCRFSMPIPATTRIHATYRLRHLLQSQQKVRWCAADT